MGDVWALLRPVLDGTLPARPEGSVTPYELAERAGYTSRHAHLVLKQDKRLRPVFYHNESGRRAVCYVTK
jgi:hypothetical protein